MTVPLTPIDFANPPAFTPGLCIVTHPLNALDMIGVWMDHEEAVENLLARVPVYFCEGLPRRSIQECWQPPFESRFFGYGAEDEDWMRPLRIGRFYQRDAGPLFYLVKTPSPLKLPLQLETLQPPDLDETNAKSLRHQLRFS